MDDFTEENLKNNCPHCDPNSFALKYPLEKTSKFWIVCDVHPLTEGHILIIPKKHLSCIGEYQENDYSEFLSLFNKYSDFIRKTYGYVSTFEHGKIGQTVFHSHVHLLPFKGSSIEIIPEGLNNLALFSDFSHLKDVFRKEGKYLYFSIGDKKWVVNTGLGSPRFFRDRFAKAIGNPLRGDWKKMSQNSKLMMEAERDIQDLRDKWNSFKK
ncbi:HIT domain-containing protein [Patescibacteria group bacterium]|nr:HIT domain-containing protein [Patescibacteria group bacterium]MBU1473048.1 HIT domain-containing protein [Patescibacteria group bacterium]MBU2460196.1 HIT domain-containing protein [Patescibacteria group bacterium]MBU2543917.1 HIT domain-containing protein [Patescibacteria group bacterium]